jgi:hypothetical protein
MRIIASFVLALFVLLTPCLRSVGADAPAKFKVGEFNFNRPAGWDWVETTSAMRKAELRVPGKDKSDKKQSLEVAFFQFPGGGGTTRANVDRWLGQFEEPREQLNPKVENKTVGGRKVTFVLAEGTYKSGLPGGPTTPVPNSMLLGGILESEEGSVFIKATGPAALAKASEAAFRKMVEDAAGGK